ncbi:helix-turn-helix domain-containing protein [Actinomadura rifamycini]|uniref:helix-turn-helix domain-containing protein n=1 Tax=Actinomadura rifamycini TaxID=31962 RepID=UPI000A0069B1|nr:helix-turn-helix transcriptional regulator [Actinomadura rifamycini]
MATRRPTPHTRTFGAQVGRLRQESGLSRLELAERMAVSRSYIAQVENGTTRCRQDFAERLDDALATGGTLSDAWTKLLQSSPYPKFFADFPEAEASAALLRVYHETFVYGLFQIEEYARTLLPADKDFEGRMRRQAILKRRDDPPTVCAILGESVLHREVGGPQVMRKQLNFLVEVSHWDNVALQIAPTAYYRGVSGSFDLLSQASGEELLHLETSRGGITSSERSEAIS